MNDSEQKQRRLVTGDNPSLKMDFPDPDLIFVEGYYYLISTTMHFLPGGQILRSPDLIHWEHVAYVFDRLDSTEGQRLLNGKYIYGKGMWAASLRYHKGTFYVVFVCNDTQKTYLYRAENIEGPWRKSEIEGFYHDCSLLFDDDDRVYVVYGNQKIYLTELKEDLTGPKEGGLHRLILEDVGNEQLGYEGSHLYKINGRYYLFTIHSLKDRWRRVEACFTADSLDGDFIGGDILNDDMDFRDSGVAQGGIVCDGDHVWHAVLFQDSGAVGRIPVVVPVSWENGYPSFGVNGKIPKTLTLPVFGNEEVPEYAPLLDSDDFRYGFSWDEGLQRFEEKDRRFRKEYGTFGLRSIWEFNHEPELHLVNRDEATGTLWITTDQVSLNVNHCKNTLTQRMIYPGCTAEVTIDGSGLHEGDVAGLAAFQGDYCFVGVKKHDGTLYEVMVNHVSTEGTWDLSPVSGNLVEERPMEGTTLRVRLTGDFAEEKDLASCFTFREGQWQPIGTPHKLLFRLDHFTGTRFGLFIYSEKQPGGRAGFSDFRLMP